MSDSGGDFRDDDEGKRGQGQRFDATMRRLADRGLPHMLAWSKIDVKRAPRPMPAEFAAPTLRADLLADGDREDRKASLVSALRLIRRQGGSRAEELLQDAEMLAVLRLEPAMISEARKEADMNVQTMADAWEGIDVGQELLRRGEARGEARGETRGETRARRQILAALLRVRFGVDADVSALADRLAAWPDPEAAVAAITTATTIQEIPAQSQP